MDYSTLTVELDSYLTMDLDETLFLITSYTPTPTPTPTPTEHKEKILKASTYCEQCDIYVLKSSLSRHVKTFKHLKRKACSKCDYVASSLQELRKHKRKLHAPKSTEYSYYYYKCLVCDLQLRDASRIEVHIGSWKHIERLEKSQYSKYDCIVDQTVLKEHRRCKYLNTC